MMKIGRLSYGKMLLKMASFDRLGRKKKQWIFNLFENGASAVQVGYEYTTSGMVGNGGVEQHWI